MAVATILFDLDDTLIDEMEWARGGWRVVAEHLAATRGGDAGALERRMQQAFARDRRRVFDQLGLTAEEVRGCVARYRETPRPLAVLPDAEAALAFAAPLRTGIVTDGPAAMQRAKVRSAGLQGRVEAIVYTGELGPGAGKPSTVGFERALAALGMPAATAVYVADNPSKDFAGPNRLGMRTLQVRRGDGLYGDVAACAGGEPDVTIRSLTELPRVVAGW